MILTSRPKPVRIRITVSGKEHTTLASLKENISPEIMDFIDGRLQSWLERQNEFELKDGINGISENKKINPETQLLEMYNLLFCESKRTMLEFIDLWGDYDLRSKKIVYHFIKHPHINNIANIKGLLKYHLQLFPVGEWKELICPLENSELEFELAKKCDDSDNVVEAIRLFERIIVRDDFPEAKEYYNEKYGRRFFSANTEEQLREIVKNWSRYEILEPKTEEEIKVKNFIAVCFKIIYTEINGTNYRKSKLCEDLFPSDIPYDDILRNEKYHFRAIVFYCYGHYRYGGDVTILFRREKDKIDREYKLRHKVVLSNTPKGCINQIIEIINYLLFEKFSK